VLLADEPTGNLDTDTRDEIVALLENCGASAA
jgi:ABC-type lipoprotein export system ATPase subunit